MEFLEVTFSRHGTCKLLYDTSFALARSSPTRRYTGCIRYSILRLIPARRPISHLFAGPLSDKTGLSSCCVYGYGLHFAADLVLCVVQSRAPVSQLALRDDLLFCPLLCSVFTDVSATFQLTSGRDE